MRIYVLLSQTTSVMTRLIKFATKTPYNHASLAFDERLEYTYSFGRIMPDDPLIGGFSHERLDTGVFKDAECQLLSLDVTEEQYEKMRCRIAQIEANQTKYKYNLLGLFGTKFNFNLDRKHTYFCSQFVSKVLQEVGLFPEDFPTHLVTPCDLAEHINLQVEYQGSLAEYLKMVDAPATPERKADILLRRKILSMPFRFFTVPFKVAQVSTQTIKTGGRYLTQSRKYITKKIFSDEQAS